MASDLPTGTVTFLFTDVEGSTKLWERFPVEAGDVMIRHDRIIEDAVARAGGHVVRPRGEGDSRFCVFSRASDALVAALDVQRELLAEPWPVPDPVRVRIGLHTGEADLRAGDYYGPAVNRSARIRGAGHGGQTLLSAATEELVSGALPTGASVKDLGLHHLRDVATPERIFQLCHDDLPSEFPPLVSLDEYRTNLPAGLSSFIGRDHEIQEVKRLVAAAPLLTLTGAAGCGKTRLALEVADELLASFPDGVWFVELARVAESAHVVDACASALGISENARVMIDEPEPGAARDLRQRLLEHLRARSLLLVLDNCEHVISSVAVLTEVILRTCAGVRILTTSREALGLATEVAWKVPSMSVPDPANLPSLDELSSYEAFRLFVERARQRRPDFSVGADDAFAIAQICRRLDGIPLAIELAAARVKLLAPAQIAARLDERFRLLVGGSRTALERQQTLRATVDWSWEPLSDPERALFRRLGSFTGGFTLEAAEAVCAGDQVGEHEVLDLLSSLVDKSLVEAEAHDGDVRYRMLETFRQYAREKLLESGEMTAFRRKHRDRFLALADRAAPHLESHAQAEWFNRLEIEHDNIRAALDWSLSEGEPREALRIAASIWAFWFTRGYITEGRTMLAQALWHAPDAAPLIRAEALRGAATLAIATFDVDGAQARFLEWQEAALASGDARAIARSRLGAGLIPYFSGDLTGARAIWEDAVQQARAVGDDGLLGNALSLLADIELFEGRRARSRELMSESIVLAREAGDLAVVAWGCSKLALQARIAGDYDRAHRYLEECLGIGRQLGDQGMVARALTEMAATARNQGDTVRARALVEQGRNLRAEIGVPPQSWVLQLAKIDEVDGNLAEAAGRYEEVAEQAQRMNLPGLYPSAIEGLARIAHAQGRYGDALEHSRVAIREWAQIGHRASIPDALAVVAGCLARQGRAARAARLFGAVEAVRASFGAVVPPSEVPGYETDIGLARAGLGPEDFEIEWAGGGRMSLESAVAFALEQHPAAAAEV